MGTCAVYSLVSFFKISFVLPVLFPFFSEQFRTKTIGRNQTRVSVHTGWGMWEAEPCPFRGVGYQSLSGVRRVDGVVRGQEQSAHWNPSRVNVVSVKKSRLMWGEVSCSSEGASPPEQGKSVRRACTWSWG